MTFDEIIQELAKYHGQFVLGANRLLRNAIRSIDHNACPAAFLCIKRRRKIESNADFKRFAKILDCDESVIDRLVKAADRPYSPDRKRLRESLGV